MSGRRWPAALSCWKTRSPSHRRRPSVLQHLHFNCCSLTPSHNLRLHCFIKAKHSPDHDSSFSRWDLFAMAVCRKPSQPSRWHFFLSENFLLLLSTPCLVNQAICGVDEAFEDALWFLKVLLLQMPFDHYWTTVRISDSSRSYSRRTTLWILRLSASENIFGSASWLFGSVTLMMLLQLTNPATFREIELFCQQEASTGHSLRSVLKVLDRVWRWCEE